MLQKEKWSRLQKDGYHPDVQSNIARIEKDIKNIDDPKNNLMKEWSNILGMDIDCRGKAVLEIGHGGGWYLAQCITKGASLAVGIEIDSLINEKAALAFDHFNYKNYKLYEADETCLEIVTEKIDYIYSITVFQHIHPDLTKKYLHTAKGTLTSEGLILCQFLMNNENNTKNCFSGEGTVRYSEEELQQLFNSMNINVVKKGQLNYPNPFKDFWGIYALQFHKDN